MPYTSEQQPKQPYLMIPREHGVWAMFLAPFLLGIMLTTPTLLHVGTGIGLLSGYMMVSAGLEYLRRPRYRQSAIRSMLIFGLIAAGSLSYPLLNRWQAFWPLAIMGLTLAGSLFFLRQKRERHFLNDLLGIFGLSMLLPIAANLGGGAPEHLIIEAMILNLLYFTGSVFFVKAAFREKQNPRFHQVGLCYHVLVVALPFVLGLSPLMALMFLPGAIKMLVAASGKKLSVATVGITEIVNVLWFITLGGWYY